jgi:hypothetical protein
VDTGELLMRTIVARILSLYEVLGYPTKYTPDPLSFNKFDALYTHRRKLVSWIVDTRLLILELPEHKRERIVLLLAEWIANPKSTFIEAAELHGILNDMSYAHRCQKSYFFMLQQTLRNILEVRYWQVCLYHKQQKTKPCLAKLLPSNLQYHVNALVVHEQSWILWNPKLDSMESKVPDPSVCTFASRTADPPQVPGGLVQPMVNLHRTPYQP